MGYEVGKLPASAPAPCRSAWRASSSWHGCISAATVLRELVKPHNVVPIFCGTIGPGSGGLVPPEITNPDQLKGLKFRAAGLGGKSIKRSVPR